VLRRMSFGENGLTIALYDGEFSSVSIYSLSIDMSFFMRVALGDCPFVFGTDVLVIMDIT